MLLPTVDMPRVNPPWGRALVTNMKTTNTNDREPATAVVAVRDGAGAAESLIRMGRFSEAAAALETVSALRPPSRSGASPGDLLSGLIKPLGREHGAPGGGPGGDEAGTRGADPPSPHSPAARR